MKTEIKEQKEGLRLDYFLSLGLKLVEGDVFTTITGRDYTVTVIGSDICSVPSKGDNKRVITSFAPRKNTGEQPCGDNVPVLVVYKNSKTDEWFSGKAGCQFFRKIEGCGVVDSWKPDLEALIKMQAEHDKKVERKQVEKLTSDDVDWGYGKKFAIVAKVDNSVSLQVSNDLFEVHHDHYVVERKEQKKTVVDAVNELKAEITADNCHHTSNENETLIYNGSKYIAMKRENIGHVCTIDEFNQCVKEMERAEWLHLKFERNHGIYHYEMYKASFKEGSKLQLGQNPLEWQSGDECLVSGCNNDNWTYGCMVPNSCNCVVFNGTGHMLIAVSRLSKPESPENKAAREREQKAKALHDLFNECCELKSRESSWELCIESLKNTFRKMIDAGVELPSNEQ